MRRYLPLLLVLALAPAARADEVSSQEVIRLHQRMQRLAQKNAWSGVERSYLEIQATGEPAQREIVLLAAEAARNRGDVLSQLARLIEAQTLADDPHLAQSVEALTQQMGRVQLEGEDRLQTSEVPFLPDAQAAIAFAQSELEHSALFDGYLPAGSYTFGEHRFQVVPGADTIVVSTFAPGQTSDLTIRGVSFPRRASVAGTRLSLNGAAERTKLGIAVYVGALYLQEATSNPEQAIRQDLPKRLAMHFVFRKTPRSAMVDFFRQGFMKVPGFQAQADEIDTFLALFQGDVLAGDEIVFDYEPGVGTRVSMNGKTRAVIEGVPFMWTLFRLFLGDDPPTAKLRAGLLGMGG